MTYRRLLPTESFKEWARFPPTTLNFYKEDIVITYLEDSTGEPIQPIMVIISAKCCDNPKKDGDGPNPEKVLRLYAQVFIRHPNKKVWLPRTVGGGVEDPPFYFISQEGRITDCIGSPPPNCDPDRKSVV